MGYRGTRAKADPVLPVPLETGYRDLVRHLAESVMEEYVFGRLSKYRAERVEEHVRVCGECQKRLQAEIEFTAAMRKAAGKITSTGPGGNGRQGKRRRSPLRSPG